MNTGLKVLVLLPVLLLIENSVSSESGMSEPIFSFISINSKDCLFEVRINDVPVIEDENYGNRKTHTLVNKYMINGVNELRVDVGPLKGDSRLLHQCNFDLEFVLTKRALSQTHQKAHKQFSVSLIHLKNLKNVVESNYTLEDMQAGSMVWGDDERKQRFIKWGVVAIQSSERFANGVSASRSIDVGIKYPPWKWINSDTIKQSEETIRSLYREYEKLWSIMNRSDHDEYVAFLHEAKSEINQSRFIPADSRAKKQNTLFAKVQQDRESGNPVKLRPLESVDPILRIYGSGKLAELVHYVDGYGYAPLIEYIDEQKPTFVSPQPFIFRRQNGKWIATR